MLQYEKNDISEGTGINKSNKSKASMICHYWYFKGIGYKFAPYVYNNCHDISIMAYELENIAIVNVNGVDYGGVLWTIIGNDAINWLNNSKLDDKGAL